MAPKSEDAGCMRHGNDHSKQNRMTCRPLGAHKVGGDNGLAVARLQRVQSSQADGYEGRGEQEPRAQAFGLNQLGKSAAGRLLSIGLKMHRG
jgi:hypothetical protein